MTDGIKFYRCNECGNLFFTIVDSSVVPHCCSRPMVLLESLHGGEGVERHLPVVEKSGDQVLIRVGAEPHPIQPEHRIEWIAMIDGKRVNIQRMGISGDAIASFRVGEKSEPLKVYAFCNLHGLWETDAWS